MKIIFRACIMLVLVVVTFNLSACVEPEKADQSTKIPVIKEAGWRQVEVFKGSTSPFGVIIFFRPGDTSYIPDERVKLALEKATLLSATQVNGVGYAVALELPDEISVPVDLGVSFAREDPDGYVRCVDYYPTGEIDMYAEKLYSHKEYVVGRLISGVKKL